MFPLALFYWGTIFWRNLFYTIGFFVTRRLPVPVISVGNLSVGGTGKTSMVIYLAEKLKMRGVEPVILSRGYRRKTSGTVVVSDRDRVIVPWEEAGDEPYFMAKALSGVPVVVDEVRYRGGLAAIEKFSPDIILLDDAFQHRSLDRDVDIVLLNSNDPPDTYKLLPYGKLREPWVHLRRADLIFWTKVNLKMPHPTLRSKALQAKVPTFYSRAEPGGFMRDVEGNVLPLERVRGEKILAFCGIGDPGSFQRLLQSVGMDVSDFVVLEDHHVYSAEEATALMEKAKACGAHLMVTTDKDIFKVAQWTGENIPLYSLGIDFIPSPEGEQALWKRITERLPPK